jgi:hypothetical protein
MLAWHFVSLCKKYNCGYEEFVCFHCRSSTVTPCEFFVDNFHNIQQKVYSGQKQKECSYGFFTWFLLGYAIASCICAAGFVGIEYYILFVSVFVVCDRALIFDLVDFVM